ncbi:MAG: polysaccharide deacetylase family protein [Limnochordia bacterium]|jgi:probable sporulation protein (polysaccharide deacetylase family)
MFSLVITRRMIRWGVLIIGVVLLWALGPGLWHLGCRYAWGVRPGVTLEGRPIGGLLEDELYREVTLMAQEFLTFPQDAYYDEDTGQVYGEVVGIWVDVAATVAKVFAASPGERVRLVTQDVVPTIRRSLFEPVYRGNPQRPYASMAINVDWGQEVLPKMLDVLDQHQVAATFFLTGRWAQGNPALARMIASRGHEIGNHGYWHAHPTSLPAKDLEKLIVDNEVLLDELTGQSNKLFAPPYGEFNERVLAKAASLGYRTILWSLDTRDWQDPSPQEIVSRIVPKAENGCIILMHPKTNTIQALPQLIKGLREKNLQLIPVGELLWHD